MWLRRVTSPCDMVCKGLVVEPKYGAFLGEAQQLCAFSVHVVWNVWHTVIAIFGLLHEKCASLGSTPNPGQHGTFSVQLVPNVNYSMPNILESLH